MAISMMPSCRASRAASTETVDTTTVGLTVSRSASPLGRADVSRNIQHVSMYRPNRRRAHLPKKRASPCTPLVPTYIDHIRCLSYLHISSSPCTATSAHCAAVGLKYRTPVAYPQIHHACMNITHTGYLCTHVSNFCCAGTRCSHRPPHGVHGLPHAMAVPDDRHVSMCACVFQSRRAGWGQRACQLLRSISLLPSSLAMYLVDGTHRRTGSQRINKKKNTERTMYRRATGPAYRTPTWSRFVRSLDPRRGCDARSTNTIHPSPPS